MSSGGGGATNNSVAEFKPPEYTTDAWKAYVGEGAKLASTPYQQYQGQTIAGNNQLTNAASDMIYQKATLGSPDVNAARGSMTDMVSGAYLNSNPWLGNDYTNAVIGQNANTMAQAHATGTAAQNDAMAVRAGQYGSSGWGQNQANAASGLQSNVGKMANELQLGRMGLGAQDYQSGIQAMQGAAGQIQGLAADDWTAAKNLMAVGEGQKQYEQDLLNSQKNEFDKQQMFGYSQMDAMGNILSRASGGYGTNIAQSGTNQQISPISGLLGAGALGYGAYKAFQQ